jgi:hypothetical protein
MPMRPTAPEPAHLSAAATLVRLTVSLSPQSIRPFFAVCAEQGWRRLPVRQLADWSGIPLSVVRRRLAEAGLTPAGVAAWHLALHAAWLLDVTALPPGHVARSMQLGRVGALAAALGARGIRLSDGRLKPGTFAATLDRYMALLHASFPE